jgi:hypothetical protein
MDKLNFYYQMRNDGGLRSGVDFNGERILESFKPGRLPQDSRLIWFIDIRCSGRKLPSDGEAVRDWFLAHKDVIQIALRDLAKELHVGIDREWPVKKVISPNNGLQIAIYCSTIRRLEGRDISQIILNLGKSWPDLIRHLEGYQHPHLVHG